ncbi:MAG: type II secretion system protein, partial [Sedimentisphaerales bacterium]|nr:type II secretion system protein [Sedimentisphaerales bacterium]
MVMKMPCGQNTDPGSRRGRLPAAAPAGGFTLVEVMASVLILAILLAGVLMVYRRTTDGLEREGLRQAAGIVAQRRMEI